MPCFRRRVFLLFFRLLLPVFRLYRLLFIWAAIEALLTLTTPIVEFIRVLWSLDRRTLFKSFLPIPPTRFFFFRRRRRRRRRFRFLFRFFRRFLFLRFRFLRRFFFLRFFLRLLRRFPLLRFRLFFLLLLRFSFLPFLKKFMPEPLLKTTLYTSVLVMWTT